MQWFSLKWKSAAIFVVLVTLPTLIVGNFVLSEYDRILSRQFADSMDKNLNTVEINLSEKIKTVEDISDYMIYKDIFRDYMTMPEQPDTLERIRSAKKEIEAFATFQLMSKKDIKSISIRGFKGSRLDLGEPVTGEEGLWTGQANESAGSPVWSDAYPIVSSWTGAKRVLSMFRVINSFEDVVTPVGMVTIRLDEADIANLLNTAVPEELGRTFMLRRDGSVLLSGDHALVGLPYPEQELIGELAAYGSAPFRYESGGTAYLVFSREMKATGWSIVAMVPEHNIVGQTQPLKATLRTLVIVMIILGLLALAGFDWAIIRPILELRKETHKLKKGDFTAQVEVRSRDEIGELGRQFNHMVQTIKELIDNKYKLEIRQRESELKILQQQMDPHFLYNTLDMIRWSARLENAMETSRLIELLSRFFRTGLDRASMWTTLAQELEFVQSYLDLQQKRLGPGLKIAIHWEAGLEQAVVLQKIVQPLVENSIKYGYKPRQGCFIRVRCFRADNELVVEVADSGGGFEPEQIRRLQRMFATGKAGEDLLGHALCNIHERLSIVYGSDYGVELPEQDMPGAFVRLRMPLTFRLESGDSKAS
ncbi:sensor histidine kinase [Paenibacillus hodogayensis]|uniref:Sensor histidine kinase n=1 Tax=Paenibacillus hodogayensis TaxID=279208 RepID=A0ABV5W3R3_9BACL